MNAEDAYLRNGLADLAHIWNWSARTPRESAQNKIVFVQGVLSYRSMKMAFSLLVSAVCLGHMTLPCVLIVFKTTNSCGV